MYLHRLRSDPEAKRWGRRTTRRRRSLCGQHVSGLPVLVGETLVHLSRRSSPAAAIGRRLRAPAEEEDRPSIRCTYTTKAGGDDNVVEFTRARCGDAVCWAFPKGDQTAVLMQGLTLTIYKPPPRKYSTRPSTNTSLPFAALARLQGALGRWIRPVLRDFLYVWLQIFKVLNRSVLAVCGVARFAEFAQVHEPNGVQRHRFDLFLSSGPTFLLRHTKGRSPFGGVAQCGVEWSAQCVWRGAVCMRRLEFST